MSKIVISDLDGTIADIEHRRHWLDKTRHLDMTTDQRWRTFYEFCIDDKPNWPVITTLFALHRTGHEIHIFSGRSDEVKAQTLKWLAHYEIGCKVLRMRAASDFTPDDVLKEQWISEYDPMDILCIFDDRQKVVDMWRAKGFTCFQVAPGDF